MRPSLPRLLVGLAVLGWAAACGWGLAFREPDLSNPRAYPPWNMPEDKGMQIWVALDDLPDWVWQAFVAAVDPALFERSRLGLPSPMTLPLTSHKRKRGPNASTFEEIVLGWRLDAELTRRELVELYLNVVFLGREAYGVEAGALRYFGKPAARLDPGEAALLAGLPHAPTRYDPDEKPESARQRRAFVLGRMVEKGWLTRAQAAIYEAAPR